ncbi:MAG: Ig-like domain-containing protein, partial [Candidatus Methanomethylophilaceae archaeon]|nr:Ig-like domain-containing protein [Candidatus Methanomethylophilaceae archaeon]
VLNDTTYQASVVVDVADPSVLTPSVAEPSVGSEVSRISVYADYSRMPYMPDGQSGDYERYSYVSAEVTDADRNSLPGEEVTWEVSDPSVASVVIGVDSKLSFIKPVGPGATEIRARSVSNTSIVSDNQSFTVFVPVINSVTLGFSYPTLVQHQMVDVYPYSQYVDDSFDIYISDTYDWIISDPAVISVEKESSTGPYSYYYVTALAPGNATIQAKSKTNPSAVSDVYTVTVLPYSPTALVWNFNYDTSKLNLTPGSYKSIGVDLIDAKGYRIDNPMTVWSSSNASVFDPMSPTDGWAYLYFTREGTANLTAQSMYYPDLTNTTQFVVSSPVYSIMPLTNVTTNRSVSLTMTDQFGNSIYGVKWSVSDPTILVDEGYSGGSYYAAKPGVVTVTGKYGDYPSVSYTFTVEEATISNIYGYAPSNMANGSSERISAYAYNQYDSYLSRASFEWSVDNASVLEVIPPHDGIDSYSAILRAVGVGTANVTIRDQVTGVNMTTMVNVEDGQYRPVLSGISVSMSRPGHEGMPQFTAVSFSEETMTGLSSEQLSADAAFGPRSDAYQYSFEESGPLVMSTTVLDMDPLLAVAGSSVANTVYMGYPAYVYASTFDQLGEEYPDDISWSVTGDSTVVSLVQDSFDSVTVYGEKVGTATLTASSRTKPELTASITLTVVPTPSMLQVNVSTHADISVSDVVTADAVVLDSDDNPIPDAVVTWSTSDPSILNITSVDGNQVVFTGEKPGRASISASYEVQFSPESYLMLKTTYTFNVHDYIMPLDVLALNTDWNFVSVPIPLNATQNTAGVVFAPVKTDNHSVLEYNSSVQAWIPLKTTTKLDPITGYWIYSDVPVKVNLSLSTDPTTTPPGKQLYTGWNAIGLNYNQSMEAKNMLSPIKDAWVSLLGWNLLQSEWDTSIINGGTGPYSDLRMVNTGWGYWVYVTQDAYLPGFLPSVKV